jgi:glutamate-5-semialdehyde dehydrogenase
MSVLDVSPSTVAEAVTACATAARSAAPTLAAAADEVVDGALAEMASRLAGARAEVLEANAADVEAAKAAGMSAGLLDRLRITDERLTSMAEALRLLAAAPHAARSVPIGELPGGLRLVERRRPVGVIGANYEARPNVTVDVASQLIKSRNAGVLRTGSAALGSATTLVRTVVAPALSAVDLDPAAVQLVPSADRAAAEALVTLPDLVPLVILRGSGESTRALARVAAQHGVRTLAHADGGGVLYLDVAADLEVGVDVIRRSLDRLGVCNRLNLLLVHEDIYATALPVVREALSALSVTPSLPPHDHAVGYEWALDTDREATVTVLPVTSAADAARVSNAETSGLAACIVTTSAETAEEFMSAYEGTGVFWNAPTRLLDGVKMLGVPETGINIDNVPGPRGPVTYPDLCLRQYAVLPA